MKVCQMYVVLPKQFACYISVGTANLTQNINVINYERSRFIIVSSGFPFNIPGCSWHTMGPRLLNHLSLSDRVGGDPLTFFPDPAIKVTVENPVIPCRITAAS